jgi:hypothetical protein
LSPTLSLALALALALPLTRYTLADGCGFLVYAENTTRLQSFTLQLDFAGSCNLMSNPNPNPNTPTTPTPTPTPTPTSTPTPDPNPKPTPNPNPKPIAKPDPNPTITRSFNLLSSRGTEQVMSGLGSGVGVRV